MYEFIIGAHEDVFPIVRGWVNGEFRVSNEWQEGNYGFAVFSFSGDIRGQWVFAQKTSALILDRLGTHWIWKFLGSHYSFFDLGEQHTISERAWQILEDKFGAERIHEQTALCIYDWIQESTEMIVDGFARFRLPWLWSLVQEAVDQSVDAFLLEKEYNEFIRLLQYFVELQEPRTSVVHILSGISNSVDLVDSAGNTVRQEYVERTAYYFEDLIISTLVNMAPTNCYSCKSASQCNEHCF